MIYWDNRIEFFVGTFVTSAPVNMYISSSFIGKLSTFIILQKSLTTARRRLVKKTAVRVIRQY